MSGSDSPPDRHTATRLFAARSEDLVQMVYAELRRLAETYLSRERNEHTLQPTALVHEAWLRLIDCSLLEGTDEPTARRRFLSLGARVMRQVLVDHARRVGAQKRSGPRAHLTTLSGVAANDREASAEILDVEDALVFVQSQNERAGEVAQLRIFAGLSLAEIAETLEISRTTVDSDWALARALLSAHLRDG